MKTDKNAQPHNRIVQGFSNCGCCDLLWRGGVLGLENYAEILFSLTGNCMHYFRGSQLSLTVRTPDEEL
jgi:hypothetical protein